MAAASVSVGFQTDTLRTESLPRHGLGIASGSAGHRIVAERCRQTPTPCRSIARLLRFAALLRSSSQPPRRSTMNQSVMIPKAFGYLVLGALLALVPMASAQPSATGPEVQTSIAGIDYLNGGAGEEERA